VTVRLPVVLVLVFASCGRPKHAAMSAGPPPSAGSVTAMRWATAGDVQWGLSLEDGHFEIDLARPGEGVLELVDGHRADFLGHAAPKQVGSLDPAPELETLDKEFAARSAAGGGDAWPPMFAADGAEWSDGKRVERDRIGEVMRGVLAGATMTWSPIASGKSGDLGFTVGTYTLASKLSAEHEQGSYCTIWRREADGVWKIALDVGSTTKR
jgi:hypothetical protein